MQYAARLSQWLAYKPVDPTGNLAASWHVYNFSWCNTPACWDAEVAPVAQQVPLVTGELGENDCAHGFIDALLPWLDARGASYLAWTWNTWDCKSGPALITSYSGAPTAYGQGYKDHLARLAASSPRTPTATGGNRVPAMPLIS